MKTPQILILIFCVLLAFGSGYKLGQSDELKDNHQVTLKERFHRDGCRITNFDFETTMYAFTNDGEGILVQTENGVTDKVEYKCSPSS